MKVPQTPSIHSNITPYINSFTAHASSRPQVHTSFITSTPSDQFYSFNPSYHPSNHFKIQQATYNSAQPSATYVPPNYTTYTPQIPQPPSSFIPPSLEEFISQNPHLVETQSCSSNNGQQQQQTLTFAPIDKTYTTLMPVETHLPQTSKPDLQYLIEIVPGEEINGQSAQATFDERDLLNDLNNYDLDQGTRDLINLLVRNKLTINYQISFQHLNVQICFILF